MKKSYRSYGKKRSSRRRRYRKKRTTGAKIARKMQNKSLSYVKKKYTTVFPISIAASDDVTTLTISHIGGVNTNAPVASTLTITSCNPDTQATIDMGAYQFFRITGVGFKLFFPEGTDPAHTPVQWAMGYSSSDILLPNLPFDRLQSLQNYMTSSCDSSKPVSRYFKTMSSLKRLGVEWCSTDEYGLFNPLLPGQQANLYGGQLQPNQGSSTNIKIYRARGTGVQAEVARLQLTYYIQYKGAKGQQSLTAP